MSRSSESRGSAPRSAEPRSSRRSDRPDDFIDPGAGDGTGPEASGRASDRTGESPSASGPGLGLRGWLRWFWRQLTSMRVALILLLMLAIATIPGSLLPQRSADPNGVVQYEAQHPDLFRVLDAFPIKAFDVYGSPWFSAIYLLLFVSLIGCVLPRILHHWRALRGAPPRTPARLQRMAGFSEQRISNPEATQEERAAFAERAVAEAQALLKRQRYRTEIQRTPRRGGGEDVSVSAERGYLRETGNLLFHIALLGVLVSVALGGMFSFNGQKVIVEGETLLNQRIDYDSATLGRSFDERRLEPFRVRLDDLDVDYVKPDNGNRRAIGQVLEYRAKVTLIDADGTEHRDVIRVNHPLRVHGSPVYLVANGYAPTVTVRNHEGEVVFRESVPFIPQNNATMTSLGVMKVPYGLKYEGEPTQLGLQGFFYPTKVANETGAFESNYPDLENPWLTLNVFVGDLGIDNGIPQSVYALDTAKMKPVARRDLDVKPLELTIGQTVDLPGGMGTITLDAVPRYASFDVMRNPAQEWVLISALTAIGGLLLSLFVPRRRMWVKARVVGDGVVLEYAALARGDDPTLARAVEQLRDQHRERL